MRIMFAAILGTIVVFLWGILFWTALDPWGDDLADLPRSEVLLPEIRAAIDVPGAYVFPPMPETPAGAMESQSGNALDSWRDAVRRGPTGILLVRPEGAEPLGISVYVRGLLLEFGGALLLAVVLSSVGRAGRGSLGRIAIGIAMVGFAVIAGVLVPGSFMALPSGWVKSMAGDLAVGWILAVFVIALVVKVPPRSGRHARS